jgi:hypothetical protein
VAELSLPAEGGFDDVLYYFGRWDCPRNGVTLLAGIPMHFNSPFDEHLDDYVAEYYLWPATDEEVAEGLEVWNAFAAWRARFDAGERPLPPFEATETGRRLRNRRPPGPRPTARRAVPQWRLDPDRSFASRTPQHTVRWHFLE